MLKESKQVPMKILIISDLHGNMEALTVLPTKYDQLWVLGDLVDFGPNPREVIDFVRRRATYVVRGNHDHAIGYNADPRCSELYKPIEAEMSEITKAMLTEKEKRYLRLLPLSICSETHGFRFYLCHATPTDPLFGYCSPDSDGWEREVHAVPPGCLLVGHTHLQFRREIFGRLIVNPGSLGRPKTDAGRASFATWEDGLIQFHSEPYPRAQTIEKLRRLQLSERVKDGLISMLETGELASSAKIGEHS